MNFDRNTVIGFVVLALLFFGYFYYNNKEQAAFQKAKDREKAVQDSIAATKKPKVDSVAYKADSARQDSQMHVTKAGQFSNAANGKEEITIVENNLIKVGFTNKGGQPKWVELKKFKNHEDSSVVRIAASDFDKIDYSVNTGTGTTSVADLFFSAPTITKNTDSSQVITFTASSDSAAGLSIKHVFVLKPNNYMVDFNTEFTGADKLFTKGDMNITWQYEAEKLEEDLSWEKQQSQIGYVLGGDYDYNNISSKTSKEFDKSVDWVSVKQQFFNTSFIAKNKFNSGKIEWTVPPTSDSATVVQATANLKIQVPAGSNPVIPFALYYGPNDYKVLKQYGNKMENLVNLGYGMFAFVKYINRWVILPVFDFLRGLVSSYGIVILLLTVFIRLLTSPLMYPGYKTSAQMRILRPDLAKLKEKHPDQQEYAVEQMKFMREAGVNQLAGCLPGLLQIPIFFALYSFFNSNVALRGQSFLWAKDLSSFDSILHFGFNIPLLGNHLSLFTITAVITSFLITLYGMSMTPDQNNPVMKYLPYFYPILMLFFFNRLPSALTWYYTVSNTFTLGLQYVIQNYVIDHEKLLSKIEMNRKKPKTKSKWAERMEQVQEQQKKMKEMQNKGKK